MVHRGENHSPWNLGPGTLASRTGTPALDFSDLYGFPETRGRGQIDPDYERAPIRRSLNPVCPGSRQTIPCASARRYMEFKIDTGTGDDVADIAYRVRFSSSEGGALTATLRRVEGKLAAGTGDDGTNR